MCRAAPGIRPIVVRDRFAMVKGMSDTHISGLNRVGRALVSVYSKDGIAEFASVLSTEFGVEVLSTGGTARLLVEHGIAVTPVEQVTGCGEMLDGRVKTLHPSIHGAILADRSNPDHVRQLEDAGIAPIDMVVVNLYPFEETIAQPGCAFDQAIEMIDIGGPCMLRAAAKNHKHVLVVTSPEQYSIVLEAMRASRDGGVFRDARGWDGLRRDFAREAFAMTSRYDARIDAWLADQCGSSPGGVLRYGENPHQEAHVQVGASIGGEAHLLRSDARASADTAWSFNNYVDGDAALGMGKELSRWVGGNAGTGGNASVGGDVGAGGDEVSGVTGLRRSIAAFIKHTNPCGCGVAGDPVEAYRRAYLGDPNAAMGGILVCGASVSLDFAEAVMGTYGRWGKDAGAGGFFVEVWIAPAFSDEAVGHIREAKAWGKRVRLISVGDLAAAPDATATDVKCIAGGSLVQTRDLVGLNEQDWDVVTKRQPTDAEWDDLRLAWLICKHTKSNAITICKDGTLLGNGAGQMSRVMSCRIAMWLAEENGHADRLAGSVAASDAFFPFPDGPINLMGSGVKAIIQPGGSKRDADTIAACDERGVAMVLTKTRHFKH